jgi:hypothetical protein
LTRRFYFYDKKDGADVPYLSKAQEAFFNVNRKKLEAQGVNVDEWNSASKGKKLPARIKKKQSKKRKKQ